MDKEENLKIVQTKLPEKTIVYYVAIKHKQMSFVSNGGKFKLYTVLDGLIFPTPTQPRISFECVFYTVQIFFG
jgi:hypothetical protein